MISDILIPILAQRFPGRFHLAEPGIQPCVVFPAIHPDVGDVLIHDDGHEITLFAGNFTHSHFDNYDEIPIAEKEQQIAENVADFLEKLFADQVVLWGSHFTCGGWRLIEPGEPRRKTFRQEYVWSGPRLRPQ